MMRRILTAVALFASAAGVTRAAAQRSHFQLFLGINITLY
jgi:hypothetical protein